MNEVTRILAAIEQGDQHAAEQLLPVVYAELRQLAVRQMANEKPGQTLQATGLVHEAYLRLVDVDIPQRWDSRGHFFAAAAEAMRRILVEQARRKKRVKHGGDMARVVLTDQVEPPDRAESAYDFSMRIVELDAALTQLTKEDPLAAEVVKLHYFAGLSLEEVASLLDMSRATAYRQWTYARSWLKSAIGP